MKEDNLLKSYESHMKYRWLGWYKIRIEKLSIRRWVNSFTLCTPTMPIPKSG